VYCYSFCLRRSVNISVGRRCPSAYGGDNLDCFSTAHSLASCAFSTLPLSEGFELDGHVFILL
jgi:hypothetical protein